MLKRIAIIAALGLAAPVAAQAQMIVADPGTHALQNLQESQLVAQVANGLKELAQLQMQLQQLQATYMALAHVTDLGTAVGQLQSLIVQNPLPLDPLAIQSMLRGGGTAGLTSVVNGLFNTNMAQNQIYTPNDGTLGSQMLTEQLNAVSGGQAVGGALYQAAGNRIELTQQLIDRLNGSETDKDSLDLIARLVGEQNVASAQTTQALAASMIMRQERDRQQVEQQQRMLQSDQAWLSEARAQTGDW